jgi:hypothetical protein
MNGFANVRPRYVVERSIDGIACVPWQAASAGAAPIVTTTSIPQARKAIDVMPLRVPSIREFVAIG